MQRQSSAAETGHQARFGAPGTAKFSDLIDANEVRVSMNLTEIERHFLARLASEPWTSSPTFDHERVARLVELGLVEAEPLASGEVEYRITEAGRAAL
ncbi:hypothetical protein BRAS3843_470020 [Bradyrhizobium sp. STM 3843]|uniref:hypothetical protein n=2 Tax=unclassified Bradyrhizobium TaxID=2631580 RepID=UPI0002403D3E|nr:hypothetical protein [Bradyrhizobium sp. STM 3843]CCE10324.1 hypothetical protein BRAS3843_470020 [Bradyrhizobium sp. STM 3843]